MRRIFSDYIYGEGPRAGCWWTETCEMPAGTPLDSDAKCDVAIIGGGFTGLNAALTLARAGVDVRLFEAHRFGWGASGRNGGFCCLGGARVDSTAEIDRRYGAGAGRVWRQTEVAAIDHVREFLDREDLNVDVHSTGETWLAHRPKDMDAAQARLEAMALDYGAEGRVVAREDLPESGLGADFHGAVEFPVGFALNPRKYVAGLVCAAQSAGASLHENAPVSALKRSTQGWTLTVGPHLIEAEKVILATNGYSSETLPDWLAGKYLPSQSSIVVSRPLTEEELAAQGWTSRQMCYDSRNLLHYFRLMPDNRMLFGMRGGLGASSAAERRAEARVTRDFRRMFPAWSEVDLTHYWSGLVCLSRSGFPFVGPVPNQPGLYGALCYHGNGVSMGSFCGHLIARQLMDGAPSRVQADILSRPPKPFPFGRYRRIAVPFVFAGLAVADW